jgi:hypothetical protein
MDSRKLLVKKGEEMIKTKRNIIPFEIKGIVAAENEQRAEEIIGAALRSARKNGYPVIENEVMVGEEVKE